MKKLIVCFFSCAIMMGALKGQIISNSHLYEPVKLPVYTAPLNPDFKDNSLVGFSMEDKSYLQLDNLNGNTLTESAYQFSPSFQDKEAALIELQGQPDNFTNLQPADQFSGFPAYPISTIVKLYVTFQNQQTGAITYGTCSGALINPSYVITAGHCIVTQDAGVTKVATNCSVIPAYNMGSQPYSQTTTTFWYSFTQWTQNFNFNYDMAILKLASPIGNASGVGWLGWGYNNNNSFFTTASNTFHSFGYPAQDDFGNNVYEGGERMYYMYGYMDFWNNTNVMCHNNIGYHGQSGSALYNVNSSNDRYVYAVLSHGNGTTAPYYTCHCRMDGSMASYFNSIINPGSPLELINSTKEISVYPNPTKGLLRVDFSKINAQNIQLRLYNALGQVLELKETPNTLVELDLSAYPNGIYFLEASFDNQQLRTKIIKSN